MSHSYGQPYLSFPQNKDPMSLESEHLFTDNLHLFGFLSNRIPTLIHMQSEVHDWITSFVFPKPLSLVQGDLCQTQLLFR